jgi:hypothetical protein
MPARCTLLWSFAAVTAATCLAGKATADIISALLPEGIPGYGTGPAVTVATRLHPEQQPLGLREGPYLATPSLETAIGYSSNALPGPYRRGSWQLITQPALGIAADLAPDQAAAAIALRRTAQPSLPGQSRTDVTATAGATLARGNDQLTLAAAHVTRHEDGGQLDTLPTDRPTEVRIDDIRTTFTRTSGRWTIAPAIEAANWAYGRASFLGVPADQSYRDRIVAQGGVTLRYELAPLRTLVLLAQAIGQDYTNTPQGQPSPDSIAYQLLAGIDYDDDTVWHWRALLGVETRRFAASAFRTQDNLIAEAALGWSPDGMTSVTATLSRETGDAAQSGTSGATYTAARLALDRECLRNLILRAYLGWQRADYFQGASQSGTLAGIGLTWVLNRTVRLALTLDQTDLQGVPAATPTAAPLQGYSRTSTLLSVKLSL